MKRPREVDLFSIAAIIKRALQSKLNIPPDDPVFKYEYNQLVMKDRELRKKIHSEIKACRSYYNNPKKRIKAFVPIDDKVLIKMQR